MAFLKYFLVILVMANASCSSDSPQVSESQGESKSGTAVAESPQSQGKYQVKSGIIEYVLGSRGVELKKMYYFDEHGKKERMEIYYQGQLSEVQLTDGINRYSFGGADDEKIVWNHGSAGNGLLPVISTAGIKNRNKFTILPNISHLGIDCESYSYDADNKEKTVIFAGYKGVQMLMEAHGRKTYDKAVKADFDIAVPADKFSLPAGYEIKPV